MTDFVANDTGSTLLITCTDKVTSLPIDLTGAAVSLKWKKADLTIATKLMTIVNAAAGKVSYQFATGELFAPKMAFEIEILASGGGLISNLDLINVTVRESIG